MYTLAKGVATVLLRLSTFCGIALTLFVALSAVMRYVVGSPFPFTEELVGLLFSALVFLALPYVTLHRQHIEVTLVTDCFPPAVRRWTDRLANGLVILFAFWFGSYAFDFALVSYQIQARTDIAGIVLWPWMALIVLACVLMAGFILFKSRRAPAEDGTLPPSGV
ncbi:TRAP transporter small permease [Bordetella sp. BOR01]|uniref:TRAP transporter small permease n=1 Tax=Bordetella sp. BOR01 TaxID=2854779 RepID=UPI001C473BEB|nr:TRAP transporter small permease [Bordetella sp. BOR01]MBV7485134.1 TRAP transporter small permease [Bordetella sp. BOR01]